jgi:hypothetical protein
MKLENPWVGYLDRGYRTIKTALVNRVKTLLPEMTDYSQSNIFMIILDYMAALTELLNYYVDVSARELYVYTAQHISSMIQLSRLIDYRIKARIPSTVRVTVQLLDQEGNPAEATQDIIFKGDNILLGSNGVPFRQMGDVVMRKGSNLVVLDLEQSVKSATNPDEYTNLGLIPEGKNPTLPLPSNYADGSGTIYIGGEQWDLVETLGFSSPYDQVFVVEYVSEGLFVAKFGDGIRGAIPRAGAEAKLSYNITQGINGNLDSGTITDFKGTPNVEPSGALTNYTLNITNPNAATGGSDRETIEDMREHLGCSLRTLDRAVTFKDFIDIAKLCPGVDKVGADFSCETGISYYITPDKGGEANELLLRELEDYVDMRKVLGVPVQAFPAGETQIYLSLTVWGKYGKRAQGIQLLVETALVNEYSYNNSDINRPIYTSDIIALVDNLDAVDHLTLDELYLLPYGRKAITTENPNAAQITFPGYIDFKKENNKYVPTENAYWALIISLIKNNRANMDIIITKNGAQVKVFENVSVTPEADGYVTLEYDVFVFKLILNNLGIQEGDSWEFQTYTNNIDIPVSDNSVPVLKVENISLTINEYTNETI